MVDQLLKVMSIHLDENFTLGWGVDSTEGEPVRHIVQELGPLSHNGLSRFQPGCHIELYGRKGGD